MKFQSNVAYLGYNTVIQTLEIRHYGPVCDVSEMSLLRHAASFFLHIIKHLFQENLCPITFCGSYLR